MWETWIRSLGREDPLEKEMATHSSILGLENPVDGGAWWATVHRSQRVDTTKRLHFHLYFLNFLQMHLFHDNLKANKYLLENGPSPDTIEVGHCRFIFLVCI